MKVYVVTSDQPDNQWAVSIWTTPELAQAECDSLNVRGGADHYAFDEYELDPTADG